MTMKESYDLCKFVANASRVPDICESHYVRWYAEGLSISISIEDDEIILIDAQEPAENILSYALASIKPAVNYQLQKLAERKRN